MSEGNFFLDTNILIYAFTRQDELKSRRSTQLMQDALKNNQGMISYQVVQEFLSLSTRKFSVPMKIEDAELYLEKTLIPLCKIFPSEHLWKKALLIHLRWQYSFYDSLIIVAALEADCKTLYSEDLQHQQKIEALTIINPFREK